MAKYKCQLCGHIYDEEKEGVKFEDLPDDWNVQCVLHQRICLN